MSEQLPEDSSSDNKDERRDEKQNAQPETLNTAAAPPFVNIPRQNSKIPFEADKKDGVFALFAFVLGFFFARWVLFSWQGWGVTAFTIGYCGAVILYLIKKGMHITSAGWFWCAVVALSGLSYTAFSDSGLEPWRSFFLLCSAMYFVISATGRPLLSKTSNWLLLDGINAMFVIPFQNFGCQYKSLSALGGKKRGGSRQIFSIVLGLILAFIVLAMVFPLLMRADSGGFYKITSRITDFFQWINDATLFLEIILAIPIAAYLFGLIAGCAHKRGCQTIKIDYAQKTVSSFRVLPMTTIFTVLALVCGLYIVFIGSQAPYFFSAFAGVRPEGFMVYSEYARSGFFELCEIAAINLSVLTAANIFSKKPRHDSRTLKIFNSLLSLLTLLLIATALSKMALYIGVYGLSVRRVLPCMFMIFLAVVCGGVIAMQKWQFSIMRLSALVGAVMFCALCLCNPDGYVARYNADRYLSGTLYDFDVDILNRSGSAGVDPAIEVFNKTTDEGLKAELSHYLDDMRKMTGQDIGKAQDNLQNANARRKIAEFIAHNPAGLPENII